MHRSIVFIVICILNVNRSTTPNLEEIFIGRCWEYQRIINPGAFAGGEKNCTELWIKFKDAFAYKDPCSTTPEDYRAFAVAAVHDVPANKALFWESMYPFVNFYANKGQRYTTIADSLLGYMADVIKWCGQTTDPGINYNNCPTWPECEAINGTMPDYAFWTMVSGYFAEEATGETFVMLNGSFSPSFDRNSIFANYELVNLTPEKGVTQLNIWLMHKIGGPDIESCGEGSLLELENIAIGQGLTVTCTNNPPSVRLMQCVDDPGAPECILVDSARANYAAVTSAATNATTTMLSLISMVLLLAMQLL